MTAAAVIDALESLQAAVDDVFKLADHGEFGDLSDDEFVEFARDADAVRRQLATLDYPIVAEVESRGLPESHLTRTAAGFLGRLWRLTPHEAHARVREATALGPRTALRGERLEPLCPVAAGARRLGILGDAQVSVILKALHDLPSDLSLEQVDWAERLLVDSAHSLPANDLQNVARHLHEAVNPDGTEPSEAEQARRREFWLRPQRDGMVRIGGLVDSITGAKALAWFGSMSKPRPEDATGRDERSAAQRCHDAFADLVALGLRAELVTTSGSPATLHLTMTAEQFESGTGHAVTSLGQYIRVPQALRLLDECCVAWAVHDGRGGILNFGRSRRLATRDQADALLARDGGCAFPSCDHPPEWTERHHVREWRRGGETNIDNLVLLCGYHHARFEQQNWVIEMRNGVPWFIPPPLTDPNRTPIRNLRGLGADPLRV